MIIVTGHLLVDPVDRDRVIELSRDAVGSARRTPGCLDFAVSADSIDPARINVCERWTDRETLETFRGAGAAGELGDLIRSAVVEEYEIATPQHRL